MKTKEQILEAVKNGRESQTLDGRDYSRLSLYFGKEDLNTFGMTLKDPDKPWVQYELTEAAILEDLKTDLDFAFEKALDKRGLSAGMMYEVIKMWMWVLDDPLQYCEDYAQYGLPFLKKVALEYSLPNPIGEAVGDEFEYSAEAE